jgi:predicted hydrocarbon binding protein
VEPTLVDRRSSSSVRLVTESQDGACRVRGFGVLNSMHFVHTHHGGTGVKRVLARLGERDLTTVDTMERFAWYPFALHCRVLRAVDVALGSGDFTLLYDVGKHAASRDWPRLFRPILRLGKPGWMLDVATKVWRVFHGEGTWHLERTKYEIVARLDGWREPDPAYCASFVGYMTAALELSGATEVDATHALCAAHGAPHCVYTVRFSAR